MTEAGGDRRGQSGPGGPRGDGTTRWSRRPRARHDDSRCTVDDLVAGAVVSEARLRATADGLVFEGIELVAAAGEDTP